MYVCMYVMFLSQTLYCILGDVFQLLHDWLTNIKVDITQSRKSGSLH